MTFLPAIFRPFRPRSNGVPVRRDVSRLIRRGNIARSRGEWSVAAKSYGAALAIAPGLTHIWVQLGHARKEGGFLEEAQAAYREAAKLAPADPDPRIHLGLSAKLLGRSDEANMHYLAALERLPGDLSITIDALRTIPGKSPAREQAMAQIAALHGLDWRFGDAAEDAALSRPVCTDVTDLLAYFGRARLPTGIQRVQIECVLALSASDPERITICGYSAQRRGWSAIDVDGFVALARLALVSDDHDDPAWRRAIAAMHVSVAVAPLLRFAPGAVLLNLGSSWSERNYFLHVRAAHAESGVAYVPIVYDCIPMFAPQWFPSALVRDYRAWMDGLFDAASGMIAISQATKKDLLAIAADHRDKMSADAIHVVPMNGDFRRTDRQTIGVEQLDRWGLGWETYVLMVSTIEPRKNHVGAFEAWLRLAERHGAQRLPMLVCVGGKGWLNDPVHALLRHHHLLRRKVVLLSGITDDELDLLYRCARFTLYPSLYEGWGLPVTESLCYGRVPAISNRSSLPEAGSAFAIYFDPDRSEAIADAIEPLIFDPAFRRRAEQRIEAQFRPRPWHEIGIEIADSALAMAKRNASRPVVPAAQPDLFYTLGTDYPKQERASLGERFRAGWNWAVPSVHGNPLGEEVSMLSMMLPEGEWSLHLLVSGDAGSRLHITTSDGDQHRTLDASFGQHWISLPLAGGHARLGISASGAALLLGFAVSRPGGRPPAVSG